VGGAGFELKGGSKAMLTENIWKYSLSLLMQMSASKSATTPFL
jgi:hypothetical protein